MISEQPIFQKYISDFTNNKLTKNALYSILYYPILINQYSIILFNRYRKNSNCFLKLNLRSNKTLFCYIDIINN